MSIIFDRALNIFLKYVPEDEIDEVLYEWLTAAQCNSPAQVDDISISDYYDLLRPVLVARGEIDDDTGDEI